MQGWYGMPHTTLPIQDSSYASTLVMPSKGMSGHKRKGGRKPAPSEINSSAASAPLQQTAKKNVTSDDGEREDALKTRVAYRHRRNTCLKGYRKAQLELVMQLDGILPDSCRSVPRRNMGVRGIGTNGRSLLNVLEDVRTYLRSMRDAGLLPAASRHKRRSPSIALAPKTSSDDGAPMLDLPSSLHREALMQSRSIFAVELENPWTWTVTRASQGASDFFRDAPFDSIVGQSLAHLMSSEDLLVMRQMWPSSSGTGACHEGSQRRLHMIDFSASIRHIDDIFSRDPLEWQHSVGATDKSDELAVMVPSRCIPMMVHMLPLPKGQGSEAQGGCRGLLIASLEYANEIRNFNRFGSACWFRTDADSVSEEVLASGPMYRPECALKDCPNLDMSWDACTTW